MAPVLIVKVTGNININVELHYRRTRETSDIQTETPPLATNETEG
jgi:fructose-1-phosphate kinase PfkB-like protein